MTPRLARLALCAFLAGCAGVWWNLMYMQRGSYSASLSRALGAEEDSRSPAVRPEVEQAFKAPPASMAAGAADRELVRAVQRELAQRGYEPGPQDGALTAVTRAAILAYEQDQGLPLTGEPSERLLKGLLFGAIGQPSGAGAQRAAPASPQAAELITFVQSALARLGYGVRQADGRLGEETQRAIRKFETDHGLPATGRISGPLVARLAAATGTKPAQASR